MKIVCMVFFICIAITFLFKIVHLIYLLFKLGFNFEVIKFLGVLGFLAIFSTFILVGTNYSTAGFLIPSILGGALLPSLFDMTKMKPKSHYGKKKPQSVSESNYAWSYYGGGNGDCGNVGFSNGSISFSSDSGGDCGGGGGGGD